MRAKKRKILLSKRSGNSSDFHTKIQDFKTIVIYGSLGIATIGGIVWAVDRLIKKSAKNNSATKSLSEGDPASFASDLISAFDNDNYFGWGTNVEKVYDVFNRLPSQRFYQKVIDAYKKQTGKNLNTALVDELSTEELQNVKQKLNQKPV